MADRSVICRKWWNIQVKLICSLLWCRLFLTYTWCFIWWYSLLLEESLKNVHDIVLSVSTLIHVRWMLLNQVFMHRCWWNIQRPRSYMWTLTPKYWPWWERQSVCHGLVWTYPPLPSNYVRSKGYLRNIITAWRYANWGLKGLSVRPLNPHALFRSHIVSHSCLCDLCMIPDINSQG